MNHVQQISVEKINGNYTLVKDGIQASCSEKQPIPTMGEMGSMQIINIPCNSACPFANLVEEDGQFQYIVACRNETQVFNVELQETKKTTTPLIQM